MKKNHIQEESVWLIMYHKDSPNSSVYYTEAVEEALCFGWIDSKPNKRDAESYLLFFCKRKPKSNWSKLNRERVAILIKKGLMTLAGQAMIDLAKKSGTWMALNDADNTVVPPDLKKHFDKKKLHLKTSKHFHHHQKK